jgi:hypothetical protein
MRKAGLIGWMLLLLSFGAAAETFEYADLIHPKSTLTIDASTARSQVAIGDIAQAAIICTDGHMVCVISDAFAFAVPLKLADQVSRWSYSGREYVLESTGRIAALGVDDDQVRRIRSTFAGATYLYVHSPRRGLIAVQVSSPEGVRTFVSTKGIGFGADPGLRRRR